MQRSISISASIPLISNRPASRPRVAPGVRLKLPSIAWTAALIALGLGPASAIAEGETPTMAITLHNASEVLGIGTARKGPQQGRTRPARRFTANIRRISSRRTPRRVGRPGSDRVIQWRRPPRGT